MFKVGDKIKLKQYNEYEFEDYVGQTATIIESDDGDVRCVWDDGKTSCLSVDGPDCFGAYLINEGEKTMRRTFRQLKTDYRTKKGATWQEACEDGTQPYEMITPDFSLAATREYGIAPVKQRNLIEENSEWFVEVFQVEPQYMTQEELDLYESFKRSLKPVAKKRGRPGKKVKKS